MNRARRVVLSLSLYTPHPAQQSPSIGSEGKKLPPPLSLSLKRQKSQRFVISTFPSRALFRLIRPFVSLLLSLSLCTYIYAARSISCTKPPVIICRSAHLSRVCPALLIYNGAAAAAETANISPEEAAVV